MQELLGLAYHVLGHVEMGLWRSGDTRAAWRYMGCMQSGGHG